MLRFFRIFLALGLLTFPLSAMEILEPYLWKYRLILYTVDPEDAGKLRKSIENEAEALRERDLRLIAINGIPEVESGEDGFPHLAVDREDRTVLAETLEFRKGRNEFVLIGKDGGVKERIDRIDFDYLFRAIDRMPMRRAEMRAK